MSQRLGVAAAVFTGVQVGAAMVATRALDGIPGPAMLGLLRYGVALAVLALPLALLRWHRVARGDWPPLLLLGVVQFGVLIGLLNWGLERIPAAQASLLFATMPLMTLALAAALGREALTVRKLAGFGLTLAGVALTLGPAAMGQGALSGDFAVLGAAGCGALAAVFYRPYLQRYPTLQVGGLAMGMAVLVLAGPALVETPLAELTHLAPWRWALVGVIGLSSGVGYLLWLTALRHLPAGTASIFLGLSPVTATALGMALAGETALPDLGAGMVLVLIGVTVALFPRRAGLAIEGQRR